MTNRHRLYQIATRTAVAIAAICIAIGGARQAAAEPVPSSELLSATTVELAWDAQRFMNTMLSTSLEARDGLPWLEIIDLDDKLEVAALQHMRDVDVLGVMQGIAARAFEYYDISNLKVACLTGAFVAAYANNKQVSEHDSKREMLYALAYTQFEQPGASIEEGVAATAAMMRFPEGVAAYNYGIISGPQACNTQRSDTRLL